MTAPVRVATTKLQFVGGTSVLVTTSNHNSEGVATDATNDDLNQLLEAVTIAVLTTIRSSLRELTTDSQFFERSTTKDRIYVLGGRKSFVKLTMTTCYCELSGQLARIAEAILASALQHLLEDAPTSTHSQ